MLNNNVPKSYVQVVIKMKEGKNGKRKKTRKRPHRKFYIIYMSLYHGGI